VGGSHEVDGKIRSRFPGRENWLRLRFAATNIAREDKKIREKKPDDRLCNACNSILQKGDQQIILFI